MIPLKTQTGIKFKKSRDGAMFAKRFWVVLQIFVKFWNTKVKEKLKKNIAR